MGRQVLDAAFVSLLAAQGLKSITNEGQPCRPRSGDGFPSAHTAMAWAMAEAATQMDHDVRPYVYAYATAVGISRVEVRRHTVLQTVAGAALGYTIGHASARTNGGLLRGIIVDREPLVGGNRFTLALDMDAAADCDQTVAFRVWEASW